MQIVLMFYRLGYNKPTGDLIQYIIETAHLIIHYYLLSNYCTTTYLLFKYIQVFRRLIVR